MSCLQDVPFRMTINFFDESLTEASFVEPPELVMPNHEEILMGTMHDFLLEKKVLYWIDSASRQNIPWYNISTDVVPTAPPCWLLLVDTKENVTNSHRARSSKVKNMTPIQRCVNLCAAAEKFSCTKNKVPLSEKANDDQHAQEEGFSENEESSSPESDVDEEPALDFKRMPNTLPRFLSLPQCRPKTSPVLLAASLESSNPKPPLVKQKRSMFLFSNVKNELQGARKKITAFMHPSAESTLASRAFSLHQRSRSSKNMRYGLTSNVSLVGTLVPTPPPNPRCSQSSHTTRRLIPPVQSHKPTVAAKDLVEKFFSQQVEVLGKRTAPLPEIYYIEGTLQVVWVRHCFPGYGINPLLHPGCPNCCVICSPGTYNPHEGTHCLQCNKSLEYGAKSC